MTNLDSHSCMGVESEDSLTNLAPQPLAKNYALINLLVGIIGIVVLVLVALGIYWQPVFPLSTGQKNTLTWIIGSVILISSLITLYQFAADKRKFYALRDSDLHYMSGLFFRKVVSQPITRIQHVELKRGPIDRKKGLAKLQVFSAGGASHTFEIPGLPVAKAESIRQFILQHKDMLKHG
ncbi:PH domain-containing protein [Paraglaciecola aestuariivivens]